VGLVRAIREAVSGLRRVRLTVRPKAVRLQADWEASTTRYLSEQLLHQEIVGVIPTGGIIVPVGSRVTCSPPPTDTDEDYLLLVENSFTAAKNLEGIGFEYESDPEKVEAYMRMNEGALHGFTSMRFGDINYIITDSPFMFERFLTATYIARELNLLEKKDRVMLFKAIRGGSFAKLVCPEMAMVWRRMEEQNEAFRDGRSNAFPITLLHAVNAAEASTYPF